MTNKRKLYKTFTKEFKLEALRMIDESDRQSGTASLAAWQYCVYWTAKEHRSSPKCLVGFYL